MKKIIKKIFILTLSLISFFLINKISWASDAYITGCLKIINTYKPTCHEDIPCFDLPQDLDLNIFNGEKDHIAKIQGSGFPIGKDVYIVGCVSTSDGIKCTTGDANLNNTVNGMGFSVVDNIPNYFFKAVNNPVNAQDGTVSVIVRSRSVEGRDHLFFGVVPVDQQTYQGEAKTITYGTFGFSEDPKKCIGINWDPKGRVFDSSSLEPLPAVDVTLLDSNKKPVSLIGVENPVITKDDGLFNFFVPSGIYYLDPKKNNYQFPLSLSEVNGNYNQAYYCDKKVSLPLYTQPVPIPEENELIHCDIPLKPLGIPYQSEPKLLDYGYMVLGDSTKFFGRYSHPLVIINLKQKNRLLTKTTADKLGSWEVIIENNKISPLDGEIELEAIKNQNFYSPTQSAAPSKIEGLLNFFEKILSKIFKQTYSQTVSNKVIFHPILRYIEGYAYNNKGEIIPNATVKIIVQMNNKVYYETKADGNGFFTISPNNLPIFPYHLEITDPKTPSIRNNLTTSYFVKLNKDYLEKNNLNLVNATKNNQPISTDASQLKKQITPTSVNNNFLVPTKAKIKPTIPLKKESRQAENPILMVVVILILLIVLVAGLIFYSIKKNKSSSL